MFVKISRANFAVFMALHVKYGSTDKCLIVGIRRGVSEIFAVVACYAA